MSGTPRPAPPRPFGLAPWLGGVAVLLLVATVYFSGRERGYANELAWVREALRLQTMEVTRLREAFGIATGAGTLEAPFSSTLFQGKVYVMPASGILLIASNLRPAGAGRTYAMWILREGGAAAGAGLFQPDPSGAALHVHRGTVDLAAARAVAVTVENEGGSSQPTSQPIAIASLAR